MGRAAWSVKRGVGRGRSTGPHGPAASRAVGPPKGTAFLAEVSPGDRYGVQPLDSRQNLHPVKTYGSKRPSAGRTSCHNGLPMKHLPDLVRGWPFAVNATLGQRLALELEQED